MVEDLRHDIFENKAKGEIVGQITASAEGVLSFELVSSDPMGAMSINERTGVLTVEIPEYFDFEERTNVSGVVQVTSGADIIEARVQLDLLNVEAPIEDFNRLTKHWKTSKFSWNGVFASMDRHTCRLDDKMSLSGTGMYTYDGGAELCGDEDNQQLKTGTWDLDENLQYIIFDKDTDVEQRAEIDFFTEGQLSLSMNYLGALVSGEFIID